MAALRSAGERGDAEALRKALDAASSKDINAQDLDSDLTPLALAAQGGHTACVRLLLTARADPDVVSEDAGNRAALHFAAYEGHVEAKVDGMDPGQTLWSPVQGGAAADAGSRRCRGQQHRWYRCRHRKTEGQGVANWRWGRRGGHRGFEPGAGTARLRKSPRRTRLRASS
ncbi:unnamed protein product [Effrenium voratum]|uniref:Uncharacterized protein n=1 Tax=Effrenium voratum TaxID=2562239 RepID=A0AA36N9Z2_9DINO|nr:unnamed protein product [Effrenium voratum]